MKLREEIDFPIIKIKKLWEIINIFFSGCSNLLPEFIKIIQSRDSMYFIKSLFFFLKFF